MSEEIKMPNPPEDAEVPAKKNRTVLWIILAVVAVILICMCVVIVGAVVIFSISGSDWGMDYYYQIPNLLSLI